MLITAPDDVEWLPIDDAGSVSFRFVVFRMLFFSSIVVVLNPLVGSIKRSALGTLIGMINADVLLLCLTSDWTGANLLLFITVAPSTIAGARNRTVRLVGAIVLAMIAGAPLILFVLSAFIFGPNPGVAFGFMFFLPAVVLSLMSFGIAKGIFGVLDFLNHETQLI